MIILIVSLWPNNSFLNTMNLLISIAKYTYLDIGIPSNPS